MMKLVQKQNPDLWSRLSKTYGHKGCKYKMRPALDRKECCKNLRKGFHKKYFKDHIHIFQMDSSGIEELELRLVRQWN